MKSPKNFLRQVFFSDPHLWIAFVAAVIFILWHFLHILKLTDHKVPTEELLIVTTFGIFALIIERLREGEQFKKNTNKLNFIYDSLFDKRVSLRNRPSKREEYAYLWGGYTGTYSVYNPSYKLEKVADEQEVISILMHRYQDADFKEARYLFLTGDDSGKADLEYFQKLMNGIKQKHPDVVRKIKVKEMKEKKASSESEMYLGTRFGRLRGVMELKEPTPGSQHGLPHYYLVIDDEAVIEHYLKDHFELEWGNNNAKEIENFWDS